MQDEEQALLKKHGIDFPINLSHKPDYNTLVALIEDRLQALANDLEKNANLYAELSETQLSAIIVTALNTAHVFFKASIETNSRGHVDITVTAPTCTEEHNFTYIGEAKIWKGNEYAFSGVKQLQGYFTGRLPGAFMIFYFKGAECDRPFSDYVDNVIIEFGGTIKFKEARRARTEHVHTSTALLLLSHHAVHLPKK